MDAREKLLIFQKFPGEEFLKKTSWKLFDLVQEFEKKEKTSKRWNLHAFTVSSMVRKLKWVFASNAQKCKSAPFVTFIEIQVAVAAKSHRPKAFRRGNDRIWGQVVAATPTV